MKDRRRHISAQAASQAVRLPPPRSARQIRGASRRLERLEDRWTLAGEGLLNAGTSSAAAQVADDVPVSILALEVAPVDDAVVLPGQTIERTFQAAGTGGPVTFTLLTEGLPGATLDPLTGEFRWTIPATGLTGVFAVTVRADSGGDSSITTLTVNIPLLGFTLVDPVQSPQTAPVQSEILELPGSEFAAFTISTQPAQFGAANFALFVDTGVAHITAPKADGRPRASTNLPVPEDAQDAAPADEPTETDEDAQQRTNLRPVIPDVDMLPGPADDSGAGERGGSGAAPDGQPAELPTIPQTSTGPDAKVEKLAALTQPVQVLNGLVDDVGLQDTLVFDEKPLTEAPRNMDAEEPLIIRLRAPHKSEPESSVAMAATMAGLVLSQALDEWPNDRRPTGSTCPAGHGGGARQRNVAFRPRRRRHTLERLSR